MLLRRIQENLDSERNESVVEKGFIEQKQKSLCTCVLKLLAFSSRPLKNSNLKSSILYYVWDQKLSQQLIYFNLQIELNSALTFNAAKKGQVPFTNVLTRFLEEMEAHF